jgi:hypothetical protein
MLRAVMRRPRRRQEATRLPILPRDRDLVPNLHMESHERPRRRQEATRLPILPRDRDLVPNLLRKLMRDHGGMTKTGSEKGITKLISLLIHLGIKRPRVTLQTKITLLPVFAPTCLSFKINLFTS